MATTVLSSAGAVSAEFDVRAGQPVKLTLTSASFIGLAFLQRKEGDAFLNHRSLGATDAFGITSPGRYRVWVRDYTSGTLTVTDTATGETQITSVVSMTQAQYDAIDPTYNTLYVIVAG